MSCTCRIWEVIGAINGNCVYVKDSLTDAETLHFLDNTQVQGESGQIRYFWPDGDGIVAPAANSAFWRRKMHEHRLAQ